MAERSGAPAPNPDPAHPRLVATFGGPGSAEVAVTAEGGMTLAQLYALVYFLDLWAHELRASELARSAVGQIVAARGGMVTIPGGRPHG